MTALEQLDLPASATAEDVHKRWRSLSLVLHPDRGGNVDEFVRLTKLRDAALKEIAERVCPLCLGSKKVYRSGGGLHIPFDCPSCMGG